MDVEKFKRNAILGKEFMIGEDKFFFKPLDVSYLPVMMEISGALEKDEKAIFDKDVSGKMFGLIKDFVKNSYPELDEELLNAFIIKNLTFIQDALLEVNMSGNVEGLDDSQKKRIEEMKLMMANAKQNTEPKKEA